MRKIDENEMYQKALELVGTPPHHEWASSGIRDMMADINGYFNDSGRPFGLSMEKSATSSKCSLVVYNSMNSNIEDEREFRTEAELRLYVEGFRRALQAIEEADGE